MEITLSVRRFNPDAEQPAAFYQDYSLELDDSATVLDGLIKVREEIDGSLSMRCSCRSAICGSCAMRINGQAGLACKTKIVDAAARDGGSILVEPPGNMQVVKDLVVDFEPFWGKIRAVGPWLQPEGPEPVGEYIADDQAMLDVSGVMSCIMCGACVSDCTVLAVDPNFLGPAALAKAYRFVADPRDGADATRLGQLNRYGGVWDCTRCMQCVEVCPKGVDPMGRIMKLRDAAMKTGLTGTFGARHVTAVAKFIKHSGRVDELRLPVESKGMFNLLELLKMAPVGLRALLKRKLPPIIHRKNPGMEHVRRIFEKVEERR